MARILVLNGPNLNRLGVREPSIYGTATLEDINHELTKEAKVLGHELISRQSNAEHELVTWIQVAKEDGFAFMIFNPAGFTHTSVALRDACLASGVPFIEAHLSNPHAREPFRRQSFFSDIAQGVICGFGKQSYFLALQAANDWLKQQK